MRRSGSVFLIVFLAVAPAIARHVTTFCGTTRESGAEARFFHRQAERARAARAPRLGTRAANPSANRDIGDIAIIEDTDGVVARQNDFNLDQKTLAFTPAGANGTAYSYSVANGAYDAAAASGGTPLAALDDDDSRQITLPFSFPFFGSTYSQVFVNSDGNLTFTAPDSASSDRSLGRMTAGPPRISPLFDDLDPALTSGGVRVLSGASRVVVSWVAVPEWQDVGIGTRQTFQVALYPDGRIEFLYNGANPSNAVVGLAPGNLKGSTSLVDFQNDPSGQYFGAVAERFGNSLSVDIVVAAQKFYQTHEDAYDYLVIYNNMDIDALDGAVSYEVTVRNDSTGYGVDIQDTGSLYGSASRLQSMVNMGPLSQYPNDPNALLPARASSGDTSITALAHEAGHRFLAFASVRDPADPTARPMLGYQNAHWSFVFNSEASLLEGERIVDRASSASPRFLTTDTVQGFSPLDQYLMGFRAAQDVAPSFFVTGVPAAMTQWHPLRNFAFNGTRRDVAMDELLQVMGRRTPDYTVAQRRFRFAFLLVVPPGTEPSAADLSKVDTFRKQFESYFGQASSNNGTADTSIRKRMGLSLSPAAGVVPDSAVTATLTLDTPPAADMDVRIAAPRGLATVPATARIPAGALSGTFTITGVKPGVEELSATPSNALYETAVARVQVADASMLKLVAVSGDHQISTAAGLLPDPIVLRLTDANNLPYAGARIMATPSAGGSVSPQVLVTDAHGQVSFGWTVGGAPSNQVQLAVAAFPSVMLTLTAGSTVPVAAAVVNAASWEPGVTAGGLATITGVNLSGGTTAGANYPWPVSLGGVRVLVNGSAVPLTYVSDGQINIYVPESVPAGTASVTVMTPSGVPANANVTVAEVQPGIFTGAVVRAGSAESAATAPVKAGDYLEIYCTGLGPTQLSGGLRRTVLPVTVFIGGVPVNPTFSGLVPGYQGLYQVNVQVPQGLAPGSQSVLLSVHLEHSNQVPIQVQ
jgi:uncharacterized protein (TIGR03437 family)